MRKITVILLAIMLSLPIMVNAEHQHNFVYDEWNSVDGVEAYTCTECEEMTYKVTWKPSHLQLTKQKKAFYAEWDNTPDVTKYQIQYSTSSKFKTSKTKTTGWSGIKIKNLKKNKKYYVRVRGVYKDNGTYYGKWSKTKSVKTK